MSVILVLGGIRSGKSAFAEQLAARRGADRVLYVATGQAWDDEMEERIRRHRERRPANWATAEEPDGLDELARQPLPYGVVLVDSLSGWVANLLMTREQDEQRHPREVGEVDRRTRAFLEACRRSAADWILVSDEVGLGGVAVSPLGRAFQDAAGWANQLAAACADEVYMVVAGIPMLWKGGSSA